MAVSVKTDAEIQDILGADQVVVKYYADWCGSCKLFAPKYRRLSEDERFKDILFADVDAENNPQTRKLAGVDTLPYFAIFKKGILIDKVSTTKEEAFISLLEKL